MSLNKLSVISLIIISTLYFLNMLYNLCSINFYYKASRHLIYNFTDSALFLYTYFYILSRCRLHIKLQPS